MNSVIKFLQYGIYLIFLIFFLVFLLLIFRFWNQKFYRTFNDNCGIYQVSKLDRVKLFYKSDYSEEFLNTFLANTQKAIELYESLNSTNNTGRYYYVAIVTETCGVGCAIIGSPGIEINISKFNTIYTNYLTSKKFDSLIFYELGRNFWFYNKQMATDDPEFTHAIQTGFSVFMRNICIKKLFVDISPINNLPYDSYSKGLKEIFNCYLSDTTLNISKVMIEGKLPVIQSDLGVSGSNFWGSLLLYLYDLPGFGDKWLQNVWAELYKLPSAENETEALKNFYSACTSSVKINITQIFQNQLKWNVR